MEIMGGGGGTDLGREIVVGTTPALEVCGQNLERGTVSAFNVEAVLAHGPDDHVVWRLLEEFVWTGEGACVWEVLDGWM